MTNFEHIPAEQLAHQMRGASSCDAAFPLIDHALCEGWSLDAEKIICPVRIVWGADDRLLPWPSAAARFRIDWLPTPIGSSSSASATAPSSTSPSRSRG